MPWGCVVQDSFALALLGGDSKPRELFCSPVSFDIDARFDIYRNNVVSSLTEALQASFPVVESLVGVDAFVALARRFIVEYPPKSPYLFEYGADFSGFLKECEQLSSYPYVAEVAQLEFELLRSTHAADAEPQNQLLIELAQQPERLATARFRLAPSLRLLKMRYAAGSIWQAHQQTLVNLEQVNAYQPEWLMVSRPEYAPQIDWLSPSEFKFLQTLQSGREVEASLASLDEEFDLTACFQRLLVRKLIVGLVEESV